MQSPTHQDGDSHAQTVAAIPKELINFLQRYPSYDFMPLLELITSNSPDKYEDFFNGVAELVCRHFGNGDWDNHYLLRIMQELFRFRDAFRGMRDGERWE
jgi:hypothetical protein